MQILYKKGNVKSRKKEGFACFSVFFGFCVSFRVFRVLRVFSCFLGFVCLRANFLLHVINRQRSVPHFFALHFLGFSRFSKSNFYNENFLPQWTVDRFTQKFLTRFFRCPHRCLASDRERQLFCRSLHFLNLTFKIVTNPR